MKNTMIAKLAGVMVGATSAFLIFGGYTEALAAKLTTSPYHEITRGEVDSFVAFNMQATPSHEDMALIFSEEEKSSGIKKWIASLYYLMMMHLILSFILSSTKEEA